MNPRNPYSTITVFLVLSSIAVLSAGRAQEVAAHPIQNPDPNPIAQHPAPCNPRFHFSQRGKAAAGDVKAMFALGCLYERGVGTEKDLSKALYWYRKAAHSGSLPAMNRLGEMYKDGEGLAKDYDKAKFWLSRAARGGNSDAMNNLGMLYSYARGFPSNYEVALYWFRRSAKRDNADAMNNLGLMYMEARGVDRDYVQARKWMEASAAQKNPSGMIDLGWLLQNGRGGPRDLNKAMALYESAATAGNAQAPEMLGLLYMNGTGVPKDLEKARDLFEKAADLNDVGAMYELGQLYEGNYGFPRDTEKAKYWYERAASRADYAEANQWESEFAIEHLGTSYETGSFTERNYALAMGWYKKALAFNSPTAMDRIAYLYANGLGVPKDEAEAEKWRAKAAALRPPPKPVTPNCSDRDLEEKLRIFIQPGFEVVAWEVRSNASATCMVRNYELHANEIAHSSRRWRTVSADGTSTGCHAEMDNSNLGKILMLSPTLLAQACSEIQFSDYAAGPFVPDWAAEKNHALSPEPKLTLSATKSQYMKMEYVPLRVAVDGVDAASPRTKQGCPVLLRSITAETGLIRIDEMTPEIPQDGWTIENVIHCRDAKTPGAEPREFEFDGAPNLDEKASNTVRFFMLAGTSSRGEIRFVESNQITVSFKDPAEMPRTWGPVKQGVHVALSLDKLTYAVGEDIPLHIAAQVVSSDQPVFAEPDVRRGAFFSDFSGAFHLTLIGEDGVIVGNEAPSNLRFDGLWGSSGPAICPGSLKIGTVYPLERSAKRLNLLPRRPGTYRVFVTWSPFPASDPICDVAGHSTGGREFRPLVTVSSEPVTIRITGASLAERGVPDIPVYESWRQHFRVVDTTLGEATALEDMRSQLQWLRLTLTNAQTIDSLKAQMESGGRLQGWRFATHAELQMFFANFTGSADGHSTDPGIQRALQHLLGGPLNTVKNRDTGWSRRNTYAVVAEVRPARPEEASRHPAVSPGAPPPCAGCGVGYITWLAYIGEDTVDGSIKASVDPGGADWWSVGNQGVMPGSNSAILVVRDAR
jgi:TPR repeat protein